MLKKKKINEKNYILCTFGNIFSLEQAINELKQINEIKYKVVDNWTLIIKLINSKENLRKNISDIIISHKGYVEPNMNKLYPQNKKKNKKDQMNPLDYPIFG
tara:strand:+ start:348 stop:653 length:306 start_codon:yes stop_codon:yes gene_type:complete